MITDDVTLYQGDCLDIMQTLPDGKVDMVLADLPYAVTRNKWDALIPFEALWKEYNRIAKPDAIIAFTCQQPFTTALINSNPKAFRYCWYWYKHRVTGFLNAKFQPLRCVEDIAIFYKCRGTYNPVMRIGEMKYKGGGRYSSNYNAFYKEGYCLKNNVYYPNQIIDIPQPRYKGGHPTQKPTELMEYLINTYTNPGEIVLDNCMGSGTTGVAAVNTGRKFIGIEMDSKWFEYAKQRIMTARETVSQKTDVSKPNYVDGEQISIFNEVRT